MADLIIVLVTIYAAALVFTIFFNIALYFMLRVSGHPAYMVSLGLGPKLVNFTIANTEFRLAPIPLGGYVRYDQENSQPENNSYSYAPWYQKVLINLAGPAVCFALAFLVLGQEVVPVTLITFSQIVAIISDFSTPLKVWPMVSKVFNEGGPLVLGAVVMAKGVALNLLPFPGISSGGNILLALAEGIYRSPLPEKLTQTLMVLSYVCFMGIAVIFIGRLIF